MTPPFFYGWIIVAISMIAGFCSAGVSNVTMAVVLKPISDDLDWSRALTAAAITMGAMAGGLLSPFFGPIADRFGSRFCCLRAARWWGFRDRVSLSTEPWQFYPTFVPARALAESLLTGVVPMTAVANWFYVKRPRAIGLVAMSIPLGALALSLVYQFFIAHYGWRSAFLALGISLWTLIVIPGAIFLAATGVSASLPMASAHLSMTAPFLPQERQKTATERVDPRRCDATGTLSLLVADAFLASLGTSGIAFHTVAYFTDDESRPESLRERLTLSPCRPPWATDCGALRLRDSTAPAQRRTCSSQQHRRFADASNGPLTAYSFAVYSSQCPCSSAYAILLAPYFGHRSYSTISAFSILSTKAVRGSAHFLPGSSLTSPNYPDHFCNFFANYLLSALLIFLARRPVGRTGEGIME